MQIQFLGAARTVTGSCYVVEAGDLRFAVDFGMHQGNKTIEKRNSDAELYQADKLDFILLTHAHIDHSGLLPRAVKDGFNGPIYCTDPTASLLSVMLMDSAFIQEMDAKWASNRNARRGLPPVEPLYTQSDAQRTLNLLKPIKFGMPMHFDDNENVRFTFSIAGHILGAAFLEIEVKMNDCVRTLVFSGDLGRKGALLMHDPHMPMIQKPDYLFLESTYGDRNHKSREKSLEELVEAIEYSYSKGEKVIIPAFAIERTQEILHILRDLSLQGLIPSDMPIFVDSPLAIKATKIFRQNYTYFDKEITDIVLTGQDPFHIPNLHFTPKVEQSQAINTMSGPAIIISASGMCNAGRIRHHLRHNLWREGASIVFTGYQAVGTPGRRIVDGAKSIRVLGEELAVEAKVFTIGGFSAHAGQDELVDWAKGFAHPAMKIFFVHGEENAIQTLAERMEKELGISYHIPEYLELYSLDEGGIPVLEYAPEETEVDWEKLMYSLKVGLEGFELNIDTIKKKTKEEQLEIVDLLANLETEIKVLLRETRS